MTPVKGGTVGFADGHVAFCNACGWRGIATYPGQPRSRRRLRARRHDHQHASTYCPVCPQSKPLQGRDGNSGGSMRDHRPSKGKRKAQRAARRRNR
jgi:prepilin-type processing-associated H-X9-DG protein